MKKNLGDWGIKTGACALAMLLWFHAVTEHSYQKEIDIRLQVEGVPPDLASEELMVANVLPTQVRVLVSGRGKDLLTLKEDEFFLRVQPRGTSPGNVYSYRLNPDQVETIATGLEVQVRKIVEPREIEVEIDKRVEKTIEVEPAVDLEIAESYRQVGRIQVEPRVVKVSGPGRKLQKMRSIRTDSLVLRELHEDVERLLAVRPPEGVRLEVNPPQVMVRIEIQELAEYDIAEIPVSLHNVAGRSFVLEPPRVKARVRGGADVIGRLAPTDVHLYVDFREGSEGERLPVQARQDSLFEVTQIVPDRVALLRR